MCVAVLKALLDFFRLDHLNQVGWIKFPKKAMTHKSKEVYWNPDATICTVLI